MSARILVLWWRFPRPDFSAGERRLIAILEILARSHRVDYVIPFEPEDDDVDGREALVRAGVNVLGTGWETLARALARRPYHLVLFEFYRLFEGYAPAIRERQPTAVFVIDSVDVHFARELEAARLGLNSHSDAMTTKAAELAAYRSADAVIAVTDQDEAILKGEGGIRSLFIVPIVMPLRQRPDLKPSAEVLFVGGFSHPPNLDGVRWFVSEVWPRVLDSVPHAVFNIIGSKPPDEVKALASVPGVRVLGYVPDTAPYLDRASVSVAPLRFGAGMKGKVNEALASGIPLVTTSFGVQGIKAVSGVHAIIADNASDFAAGVTKLLLDSLSGEAMGRAGQELAKAFAPERVEILVNRMVVELVPRSHAVAPRLRWLASSATVMARAAWRRLRPSKFPHGH
jgi:glycosyltransferase involved in cell wall biosynthesis